MPFEVLEGNVKNNTMRTIKITVLLAVLLSMVGAKSYAHDIAVENDDGVTIYYNFTAIFDTSWIWTEGLEVTFRGGSSSYNLLFFNTF